MTASTSTWALISAGGHGTSAPRAHRVAPAGGDGYWRTGCGQIVPSEPVTAGPGVSRCLRCVRQLDGSQVGRPAIYGKNLHRAGRVR